MLIQPPPFKQVIDFQNCKQVNLPEGRKYLTPDGEHLPSVTTILSATKDKTFLENWKKRVGEQKAKEITAEAAGIGSAMHGNLERFLCGLVRQPGSNPVHVQANKMADVIINEAFQHISEVWAMEQSLYYPGLYSGTTDLIAVYKGNIAVCDYKQTNKPKKSEWVDDYRMQISAYILATNEVYKTNIQEGHVFMCARDLTYQQFDVWPDEYEYYEKLWLGRVAQFYGL